MARWLFLTATMALVFGHAEVLASAQDPAPDPPEVLVADDGFDPDHVTEPKNPVSLPDSFFERYFLGDVSKLEQWHGKMDRLFEAQMRLAGKVSKFSANEERKLRLAAKGDIKHLADELEMARSRVEEASADLQNLNVLLNSYRPLRLRALSGPFRSDSLFQKTLEGIRRKQREGETRSGGISRGLLATLNIALLAPQEPAPAKLMPLREVIDDASRLRIPRQNDEIDKLRDRIERRNRDRQLVIDVQLAMPPEKPSEMNPLTAIDDFERDSPQVAEAVAEEIPERFFDHYVLGVPRDSEAFFKRRERFLESELKRQEKAVSLSPVDEQKLRLAAKGDFKRLDDELAAARNRLEQAWPNQNARLLLLASLEELRTRARSNPFRANSLFDKALRKIAREKGERQAKGDRERVGLR